MLELFARPSPEPTTPAAVVTRVTRTSRLPVVWLPLETVKLLLASAPAAICWLPLSGVPVVVYATVTGTLPVTPPVSLKTV